MQARQLGNSDLHITSLGVGAWAMGGAGWLFSWSNQDDNDSIAAIHAARHGRNAGEAAIAWTLRTPTVTGAIVGVRSAERVKGVIGAMEFRLSADEIAEIEDFYRQAPATG